MIRVETGSRLHFGLLRPPPVDGQRGFGGCGLMVEAPAVRVSVEPAADWSATGPGADRALAVARLVAADRPHRIVVDACPPEHVGLGVGTQLSLAVARAALHLAPGDSPGAKYLARLAGRGGRSGIGLHGFERGGFLVDGGKRDADEIAPLVARAEFPPEWRVVLLTPSIRSDWHGERERAAFAALANSPADDALCRLVLLGMLPALVGRDLPAFGEAVYEYNARAGEPFRAAQGGTFAAEAAELIVWLRGQGVTGVGQSSWGPTVFAVVGDENRAAGITVAARRRWADIAIVVTAGRNAGAELRPIKNRRPDLDEV
jgi:beta-ribofuranosylaminobenzene 5'-phosphate synthase